MCLLFGYDKFYELLFQLFPTIEELALANLRRALVYYEAKLEEKKV